MSVDKIRNYCYYIVFIWIWLMGAKPLNYRRLCAPHPESPMNRTPTIPGLITRFIRRPWMNTMSSVGKVIGKVQDGLTPVWIIETDICLVRIRFDGATPVVEQPMAITGTGGAKPKSGRLQANVDAIVTALTQAGYTPRLAA